MPSDLASASCDAGPRAVQGDGVNLCPGRVPGQ